MPSVPPGPGPYGPGPGRYGPSFGPTGQLVLQLRPPAGLGGEAMTSPTVTIDGYPAGATWRQNSYVVPAGRRRVGVASTYLFTYGRAEATVDVAPGQTVELHYAGPWTTFSPGRLGPGPQQPAGKAGLFLAIALIVLIVVGVFLTGALSD